MGEAPKKFTYECFRDWAEDAGEHYIMTQVECNEKMLSKSGKGRSKSGRFWRGFKLKKQEPDFETGPAERGQTPQTLKNSIQ